MSSYYYPVSSESSSTDGSFPGYSSSGSSSMRHTIAHPYARIAKATAAPKRRKLWCHAHEKFVFAPEELRCLGVQKRRAIYIASLENHVDRLHAQLLSVGFWPVPVDDLEPLKGLNCKVAKSMVSGLESDTASLKVQLLELERANQGLCDRLAETASVYQEGRQGPYMAYPNIAADM